MPNTSKDMTTADFLRKIIAPEGVPQVTSIRNGKAKNFPCTDIDYMARQIEAIDSSGANAYHACATFRDGKSRTAGNAKSMLSFRLDIDCGETKGYATKKEARIALINFCEQTGLPRPMIVGSGGGLHVYWPLTASITAAEWKFTAGQLKELTVSLGFRVDHSVTADAARILRPIGTHNRKYGPPRPVVLLEDAEPVEHATFSAIVAAALATTRHSQMSVESQNALGTINTTPNFVGYVEPEHVVEGRRNDAVLRYVGHLRGLGTPERLVLGLARNFNKAKCQPPLDETEVAQIVASYASHGNPDPDDWPDPEPVGWQLPNAPVFNYDMLPDVFVDFVRDASERMGVPPDYIAVPLMLSSSAALGSGFVICPKAVDKGWKETAALWGGIVAPPGSKKSPSFKLAAAPIQRIEAKLRDEYAVRKSAYDLAKKAQKTGGGNSLNLLVEPKMERVLVQDTTYQKLAEICSNSPKGIMALWDEIAGMVANWSMQSQEAARGFYLTAWSGDQPYIVDRKESGTTRIERLYIVISGGVQPSVLGSLVKAAKDNGTANDGLIQRFQLMVYPDPRSAPDEVDRAADEVAQNRALSAIERLRDITPGSIGVDIDQKTGRGVLHFDPEAQTAFDMLRKKIARKTAALADDHLVGPHFAKMPGAIAKIAMLIHLLDGGKGEVTRRAVMKAGYWSLYLRKHAERIYELWRTAEAEEAQRLAGKLQKGVLTDGFTARDIQRKGWSGLRDKESVATALDLLVNNHWLRRVVAASPNGGPPKETFVVNPKARNT